MGQDFIFKHNKNGDEIPLYPKTYTSNVIKIYGNKQVPLDEVIDNKGNTLNYIEPSFLNPASNDLIIETLGDVIVKNTPLNINGTIISNVPPDDINYIWIDTSNLNISIMRYFDIEKMEWVPVDINKDNHSHIGMIIYSTTLDTMQKVIEIYGGRRWSKIEGRFLLGVSDEYTINSTGGESKHTLTIDEMPSHTHQQYIIGNSGSEGIRQDLYPYSTSNLKEIYIHCLTGSTGGNKPHNNIPPYKAVYIWERTE